MNKKKGLQKIKENFVPSSFDRVVVEDRGGDDVVKFGWYLHQSDFSFLREKIHPFSETYSHRCFSRFFSVMRLEPNDNQLRMFENERIS